MALNDSLRFERQNTAADSDTPVTAARSRNWRERLGFATEDSSFPVALALGLALAALPAFQALPTDMDRVSPLILLPAVCLAVRRSEQPAGKGAGLDGGLLAIVGLLSMIAVALSRQPAANLVLTCAWFWVAAGGATASRLAHNAAAVRLVMAGIAAGCALGIVWARSQPIGDDLAFPLYSHARVFGLHMLVGAAATLALLINAPARRALRVTLFLTATVVWSGLLWSGGRGPLVGLAAGIGIWWWYARPDVRRGLMIWPPALLVVGLAGSYCLGTPAANLGWHRAISSTVNVSDVQGLSSERNLIWGQTLREIGSWPWLGQGADAYRFFQPLPVGDQPHNVILQWVLSFGVIGALALVVLMARRVARGLRNSDTAGGEAGWRQAAAAASLAAAMSGLFDGVFYHAVCFIPVAVLAGIAGYAPGVNPPIEASRLPQVRRLFGRTALIASAAVLVVHSWLVFHLLSPRPPTSDSAVARVLHAFPSSTHGFWQWTYAWKPSMPMEVQLDWLNWAQRHSPKPAIFYFQEAQCHLEKRDIVAAEKSLVQAVATSSGRAKSRYIELLDLTRKSGTKPAQPASSPLPQ